MNQTASTYLSTWKKYSDFRGRASRAEFWTFNLINAPISWALIGLDALLMGSNLEEIGLFNGLFSLVALLPGLAVFARRMHDIGRSGWSILLVLIPYVGFIIILVRLLKKGDPAANKWGNNPNTKPTQGFSPQQMKYG